MNLNEAIKAMFDGKKVQGESWVHNNYLAFVNGYIKLTAGDSGKQEDYQITIGAACAKYKIYTPPLLLKDLKVGQRFVFKTNRNEEYKVVHIIGREKPGYLTGHTVWNYVTPARQNDEVILIKE